uniref:Uncharacterized protein n=1 Tax=Brassica oleracea var. oleracea TaxID=109376 RepID=A0A0D3AUQ4_BRAOL
MVRERYLSYHEEVSCEKVYLNLSHSYARVFGAIYSCHPLQHLLLPCKAWLESRIMSLLFFLEP